MPRLRVPAPLDAEAKQLPKPADKAWRIRLDKMLRRKETK